MTSKKQSRSRDEAPEAVIVSMLGWGWSYKNWELHLKSQNYVWNDGVKNSIIKMEVELFKDEILQLMSEPNTAPEGRDHPKTNSVANILKRLKGEEWIKGVPNEKEQRYNSQKLLGEDAK
jgi:hypothetical protein